MRTEKGYFPRLGGGLPEEFTQQFPGASIDPISYCTTPIRYVSNDGSGDLLSNHATGFFWRNADGISLVTARHCLSGRDPFTNHVVSQKGFIPREIEIYPCGKILFSGQPARYREPIRVGLGSEEKPSWLGDPKFDELRTDIAVLPLAIDEPANLQCLNDIESAFANLLTRIGFQCAIVGYPNIHFSGPMTPIWRTGTIASEPALPIDDKPMFLVDAHTSPGFSGSPVFRRHIGPAPETTEDGKINVVTRAVIRTSFVGVYAGRLDHDHYGGEIPYVFYGNRISHILETSP